MTKKMKCTGVERELGTPDPLNIRFGVGKKGDEPVVKKKRKQAAVKGQKV